MKTWKNSQETKPKRVLKNSEQLVFLSRIVATPQALTEKDKND